MIKSKNKVKNMNGSTYERSSINVTYFYQFIIRYFNRRLRLGLFGQFIDTTHLHSYMHVQCARMRVHNVCHCGTQDHLNMLTITSDTDLEVGRHEGLSRTVTDLEVGRHEGVVASDTDLEVGRHEGVVADGDDVRMTSADLHHGLQVRDLHRRVRRRLQVDHLRDTGRYGTDGTYSN